MELPHSRYTLGCVSLMTGMVQASEAPVIHSEMCTVSDLELPTNKCTSSRLPPSCTHLS